MCLDGERIYTNAGMDAGRGAILWEGSRMGGQFTAPCTAHPTIPCGKSWRIARRKTESGYYEVAL